MTFRLSFKMIISTNRRNKATKDVEEENHGKGKKAKWNQPAERSLQVRENIVIDDV